MINPVKASDKCLTIVIEEKAWTGEATASDAELL